MTRYLLPYLQLVGWVGLPVAAGAALAARGRRHWSRPLFAFALYACYTPIVVLATWVARLAGSAFYLPILTLSGWMITAGLSWAMSRGLRHGARPRGAFIMSMAISNHGYTLLGIVAFILFGETGLAQATYAQLLFVPFFVFCCFPIARYYSQGEVRLTRREFLQRSFLDPRNLPLLAMLAGLWLNRTGLPRPACFAPVLQVLVYLGVVVSGLAVGLLYRPSAVERYARENALVFLYRCSAYPLLFWALGRLLHLDPLDAKVLVLFGLVPSGLYASLTADLFGLDTDLTSSVFVVSTALFLFVVLPAYVLVAGR